MQRIIRAMEKLMKALFSTTLLLFVISCLSPNDTNQQNQRYLSLGAAPPGGAFFVVGGALAEVLNNTALGTNWEFTSEATKGSKENIRRLDSGELDIALSNAAITYFANRGEANWEKAYEIRALATLAPNVAMFVTHANSGIVKIDDLRGRRVVVGPAGAGFEDFVQPLLEIHGLSYRDFTPLNNTQTGAVNMLADGSAAAVFIGGAVPTASIVQAASSHDIYLVPYGDKEKAIAQKEFPFFYPHTIPANTYKGQTEPYHGLNVGSMHLITHARMSKDVIYKITRTIYENRKAIATKHPAGRAINPNNVSRDTGIDFHPGAIQFYREIGIWLEREADDSDETGSDKPT